MGSKDSLAIADASERCIPANQVEFVFSEAAQVVFGKAAAPDEVSEDERENRVPVVLRLDL